MKYKRSRSSQSVPTRSRGFTLLEVIVALGIVSVGILAVSQAMVKHTDSVARLEQRTTGLWVASNRLEILRIRRTDPVAGQAKGTEQMAGRTWYYREYIRATADPLLYRVDIRVSLDEAGEQETASLFGYLLKP